MPTTYYDNVNGRLRGQITAGVRTGYLTDALGSVTATVQAAAVVNTYRYKPYGAQLAKTGAGADPRFGWNGAHSYRKGTSSAEPSFVVKRHVQPSSGMWTSADLLWPTELPYVYSQGNPTTLIDPLGLCCRLPMIVYWKFTSWCYTRSNHHDLIERRGDTFVPSKDTPAKRCGYRETVPCPDGDIGQMTYQQSVRHSSGSLMVRSTREATGCIKPPRPDWAGALRGIIGLIPSLDRIDTVLDIIDIIEKLDPPRDNPTRIGPPIPPGPGRCKGRPYGWDLNVSASFQCFAKKYDGPTCYEPVPDPPSYGMPGVSVGSPPRIH